MSDTTLRARRDEWTKAGVFDKPGNRSPSRLRPCDRVGPERGLGRRQPTQSALRRASEPAKNPCDRAESGWKWSLATDRNGIPIGWATDGANRHDSILFQPSVEAVNRRGLLPDIETLHLDRAYDSRTCPGPVRHHGYQQCHYAPRKTTRPNRQHQNTRTPRYAPDRLTNQLTAHQLRATPPKHPPPTRPTQPCPITLIITIKLIKWRNRYNLN